MLRSWQFPVRDLAISFDGQTLVAMGGTIVRLISLVDFSEIRYATVLGEWSFEMKTT